MQEANINSHNTLLTVQQYEEMVSVLLNTVVENVEDERELQEAAEWCAQVVDNMLHAAGIHTIAAAAIIIPEYII